MLPSLENLNFLAPELILLIAGLLSLLAELIIQKECITFSIATFGLLLASACSFLLLDDYPHMLMSGMFVSDSMSQLMKVFIGLIVSLCFYYSRAYLKERHIPTGEYYVLGLFSALGMMILVSAHSLLVVYLGLELVSLPIYAMAALRRMSGDGSEAALKYFIMGALASAFLLLGISFVYGVTGELDIQKISSVLVNNNFKNNLMLAFSIVFVVSAIAFKLASVPFHMWAPDVYEGTPTAVTLFLSTAPKIAAVGMMIRLLTGVFSGLESQWQLLLIILAILSTFIGNLLAIVQQNIKRLFAYSAISHMGYVLLAMATCTVAGYSAALYYVLIYAVMTVGAFGILVLMSKSGIEVENISDLKGLNKKHPWIAFLMLIILFSMAGVPPTVGFFAKLLVLKALVDAHLTWLAILGLAFAVIGAYFYIKIVKVMYFDEPAESTQVSFKRADIAILSINGLILLYWGIFPGSIMDLASKAFI